MKKSIYISGIATANLMLFGCLFKMFHWPGASILLCLSVLLFCFIFLPFALLSSYQSQETKKYKWLYIVTFIVFFIGMMGILFKVQHWPGASLFLMIGIPLPFVLFLPVYLYQTRDEQKRNSGNFLGIMFGLTFLAVFSVLLTLNVSKDILESSTINAINNDNFATFNQSKGKSIASENKIKQESDQLYSYIHNLKCELLSASENEMCENKNINSNYSPLTIINKDNTEIPMQILFGEGTNNKLNELKSKINHYKEFLLASKKINPELSELIKSLFNVNDEEFNNSNESQVITWEQKQFPSYQLIVVLNVLSEIESNVRLVEAEL